MPEVRPQLLITVVHGTWPHGLFPKIVRFKHWVGELMQWKRLGPSLFWFEEGSPFLDRLSAELDDIPHKIRPLLWSGANSVFERDRTAHILAEHLSTEHAAHPEATQLIIAHSHGGNIALRALYRLQKREACWSDSTDTANPLVVTLATPFIEIHQADFGRRPLLIRGAVLYAMWVLLRLLVMWLFPFARSDDNPLGTLINLSPGAFYIVMLFMLVIGWYWIQKRATARQNQLEALSGATRLGVMAPQRLLVIRAIDDEASLLLAFGTIINYLTTKFIMITYWIMATTVFSLPLIWLVLFSSWNSFWHKDVAELFCSAVIITLLGVFAVSRLVYGRELAKSPMECQINTQSTPDATGLSKIITLVRRTYVKSLRHGIYDYKDCPKAISDWVRSQLYALPAR